MIVTRTPTIGSGIVYRWHQTETDRGVVSASRYGVMLHDSGLISTEAAADEIRDAICDAWQVYDELRRGRDPERFVTHERDGMFGPLLTLAPAGQSAKAPGE